MIVYACETTARTASVALCDGSGLIAEYTQNTGNTHTETLLPMTESVLKTTGLTLDDVDLFAVSSGPGSFTGVRIGAAHVKGLAFGRKKPCVGVSSLEALAYNVSAFRETAVCAMDARRSQLYAAVFDCSSGIPRRLMPDTALSPAELSAVVSSSVAPGSRLAVCGDGAYLCDGILSGYDLISLPDRLLFQSASSVAAAALHKFESGQYTDDLSLKPLYLRVPQAERERIERMSKNEN